MSSDILAFKVPAFASDFEFWIEVNECFWIEIHIPNQILLTKLVPINYSSRYQLSIYIITQVAVYSLKNTKSRGCQSQVLLNYRTTHSCVLNIWYHAYLQGIWRRQVVNGYNQQYVLAACVCVGIAVDKWMKTCW